MQVMPSPGRVIGVLDESVALPYGLLNTPTGLNPTRLDAAPAISGAQTTVTAAWMTPARVRRASMRTAIP